MCDHGLPFRPYISECLFSLPRKKWLEPCPLEHRIFYYRRYVDDTFVLFNSPKHLKRFQSYLNFPHVNISFTIENKKDNRMSFLNINIIHEQGQFTTSIYRKSTFSGIYTHFRQFLTIHLQN